MPRWACPRSAPGDVGVAANLGHLPTVGATEFHIARRAAAATGGVKRAPRMVHNIVNRALTPEHRLLEEDWRAYRAMMHNWQSAQSRMLTEEERRNAFIRDSEIAVKLLDLTFNKKDLVNHIAGLSICTSDLATHRPAMEGPPGYLYERFTQDLKLSQHRSASAAHDDECVEVEKRQMRLPLLEIDDPFQKVHVTSAAREQWRHRPSRPAVRDYDVMAIRVAGMPERALMYNEPDNVPCHLVQENFARPLTERAERLLDDATVVVPDIKDMKRPTSPSRRRISRGRRGRGGGRRVSPKTSKQKASATT